MIREGHWALLGTFPERISAHKPNAYFSTSDTSFRRISFLSSTYKSPASDSRMIFRPRAGSSLKLVSSRTIKQYLEKALAGHIGALCNRMAPELLKSAGILRMLAKKGGTTLPG